LWMKLLNGIEDSKSIIEEKAAKANILLVPGESFLPEPEPSPYVRASFSTASDSDIDTAMARLATLLRSEIDH
jgi:kynurenine/2-aminoadipate aminotransferase